MSRVLSDPGSVQKLLDKFARTTDQIVSLDGLRKLLLSGKQLRLKYGVDVTAPTLHIGHAVNLWMYRDLQELGHKVLFLVGDFTTQIGDPTGRNKTRPVIPPEQIKANAQQFIDQVFGVLHNADDLVEIRHNSEWFGKMGTAEFLQLLSLVTYERLAARDMFRRRVEEGSEVYMHEMLYPVLQGYDSVMLKSDLTIVGTDQLYNETMGRFYQSKFGQEEQVILTTRITPGIDGKEKQSKSLNNYVGLAHTPREKFGRIMSIPDALIRPYVEVYTALPLDEPSLTENAIRAAPMDAKLRLAREITARYHGAEVGQAELDWFLETFRNKETPKDIPEVVISDPNATAFAIVKQCMPESSTSAIRRLFGQRAVRIDGEVVSDLDAKVKLPAVLKVGKRSWFQLRPPA
jgi:tyrosyl-tRNA synthetase